MLGIRLALGRAVNSSHFGWISTLAITALAALLRFADLANPAKLIFDETYYVKDAVALGETLVERQWPADYNQLFEAGATSGYLLDPAFVVHPPLGKWLIWLGMLVFGADSSFGWRFSVALIGTLSVPLLIAVARLLFNSKLWAAVAGLALAIEGQHIVISRTAILDGLLTALVLLGFYFVLRDLQSWRGRLSLRPWLLAAGLALGAAAAVKWSGGFALAGFGLLAVVSLLPGRSDKLRVLFGQGVLSFLSLVPAALFSYLASWWGWLASGEGWGRNLADDRWLALWRYHQSILNFHTDLDTPHNYQSSPWQWLISWRPTSFWFEQLEPGSPGCHFAGGCEITISALPHPLIWFGGLLALIWVIARARQDRVALAIAAGFLSGWLPWVLLAERTTFQFYSVVYTPFLVLALVYALKRWRRTGLLIGRLAERDSVLIALAIAALVLLVFFLSLWLGLAAPLDFWRLQLMMPNWI